MIYVGIYALIYLHTILGEGMDSRDGLPRGALPSGILKIEKYCPGLKVPVSSVNPLLSTTFVFKSELVKLKWRNLKIKTVHSRNESRNNRLATRLSKIPFFVDTQEIRIKETHTCIEKLLYQQNLCHE